MIRCGGAGTGPKPTGAATGSERWTIGLVVGIDLGFWGARPFVGERALKGPGCSHWRLQLSVWRVALSGARTRGARTEASESLRFLPRGMCG